MKRIVPIILIILFCNTALANGYHRTYKLDNGVTIGEMGSMKYLLDEDGYRISTGYHEIELLPDGTYKATLGSMEYILYPDGRAK